MTKKILIANRGEIACRIIRSVQAAGYQAVAIYSDADQHALFTKLADQSFPLQGNTATETYLNIEKVIAAALSAQCDAVHPGYGFLSENAEFAKACLKNNIKFIGPSVHAIEVMGNKGAAKRLMIEAGVPCIPGYQGGYQGSAQDFEALKKEAEKIGYPLMIKAAAGGGGRGIRLAADEQQLKTEIASARKEALSAFGSDEVILEKALIGARHIEIQVFADQYGNVIHLGERDCSVQRRHQKVIEEAPSPFMTEKLREAMGAAAVNAAKAVNYEGAGTVEFLVDDARNFYFLEMNTRLQVEHPVTEMITGLDLVNWQLQIAEGKALPMQQQDLQLHGHAIEVRLYAEDAAAGFIPQTGCLQQFLPATGEGVRIDHGFESGALVSAYYDAMLAKIICWGENREQARSRLLRAISETKITGLKTNKNFLVNLLCEASFVAGSAHTNLIDDSLLQRLGKDYQPSDIALACLLIHQHHAHSYGELANWSNSEDIKHCELLQAGNNTASVFRVYAVKNKVSHAFIVTFFNDEHIEIRFDFSDVKIEHSCFYYRLGGINRKVWFSLNDNVLSMDLGERTVNVRRLTYQAALAKDAQGSGKILASTEGLVIDVLVKAGDAVKKGDVLVIVEAMKMEHRHVADVDGVVNSVQTSAGQQIKARTLLVEISAEENNNEVEL